MSYSQFFRWMAALTIFCAPAAAMAQQEPQESSSKRPPEPGETKPNPATPSKPDQPRYDPLRAEKDIEVGQYYLKKGNVDAAIDRFQDAIDSRPNYALPYRLLGEAQEKKGLKRQAIRSYTRYLEVYPHAEDGEKVRRRIERLREAAEKKRDKSG